MPLSPVSTPDAPSRSWRLHAPVALLWLTVAAGCASRSPSAAPPSPSSSAPAGGPVGAPLPWGRQGAPAPSPGSPTAPSTPSADPRAANANKALQDERKYLADWFSGTPVTIEIDREQGLRVEVPIEFAFEPGQAKPKPALVAVLERLGVSLRRASNTRVQSSAPADATRPDPALAERRTAALREAIMARGVNAIRMAGGVPSNLTGAGVVVRVVMPAPASTLPPT